MIEQLVLWILIYAFVAAYSFCMAVALVFLTHNILIVFAGTCLPLLAIWFLARRNWK